jgi:hypothetical protein
MAVWFFATSLNVPASIGPFSGSLFIGGAKKVCADGVGAMSNRDAMTMPMAIDITAINPAENNALLRVDIISSSNLATPNVWHPVRRRS